MDYSVRHVAVSIASGSVERHRRALDIYQETDPADDR